MTDEKNGSEKIEFSTEQSASGIKENENKLSAIPVGDVIDEGENISSPSEEKDGKTEGKEEAPSLDLLLYESESEEKKQYGSALDFDSMLGDYKERMAMAFGAKATEQAEDTESDDEEEPLLVKHKTINLEPVAADEEKTDEQVLAELSEIAFEENEEEKTVEAAEDNGEEAVDGEESGEQLELELGITEESEDDEESDITEAPGENEAEKKTPGTRRIDSVFEVVEIIIFTLVSVMLLTNFVFRHSKVEGGSMLKTLEEGDHLIISDLFYTPDYGDIVVFTTEDDKPLIKRVVALEGDVVTFLFAEGRYELYVNGELMDEDYAYVGGSGHVTHEVHDHVVGKGKVFVLGDHRNNSTDSRNPLIGDVDIDSILGKAVLRFYPFESFGKVK